MLKNFITWDLGGTKCAAGLVEYNSQTESFHCLKHCDVKLTNAESLQDLVQQIETHLECSMSDVDAICIGGAGQYDGQRLELEQAYPYVMNFAQIAKKNRWPAFDVIHDYAPIVCATFTSYMDEPGNVKLLNQGVKKPYGRRVAIGVGTGLGIKDGVLLPRGDFWLGSNEAGHIGVSLPPITTQSERQRHDELMRFLAVDDDKPLSFEKILSGQGAVRLHQFFYPGSKDALPEEVGQDMRNGLAEETLKAFAWYLGLFIGTMQLTFMPEGGIWLAGGVVLRHLEIFTHPDFQAGIDASPAYRSQRAQYPLGVLCGQDHALIGGAYYATKRLL